MAPRAFRIQRSRPCGGGGSDGTRSCENQRRGGSSSCLHLGIIGAGDGSSGSCGKSPVGVINAARQRDKDELIDLNDKFAQYVEQVRSLEALNRTYIHELDQLRKRTGQ